jgi:hypothetical protein
MREFENYEAQVRTSLPFSNFQIFKSGNKKSRIPQDFLMIYIRPASTNPQSNDLPFAVFHFHHYGNVVSFVAVLQLAGEV